MLIMTFVTKSLPALPGKTARAAIRTVSGARNLVRAWVHRREMIHLSEMDDRGLKDIGLVRSDVEGALATSWLRDPTSVLAERSGQQHSVAATRREAGHRRAVVNAPARAPRGEALDIACNA